MEAELSFIDLFLQASLLVKLVMLMLLAMSVWGWVLIFQRKKVIGQAHSDALKFEDRFWSGVDLARLYQEISARAKNGRGMELLFHAGFKEFARGSVITTMPTHKHASKALSVPCALPTPVSWKNSTLTSVSSQRLVLSVRISACSVPYGVL